MVIFEGQKCYTLAEAAEILSLSVSGLRLNMHKGNITPIDIAGKKLFPESEIKRCDQRKKKGARQGVR